jgi:hypothetical protein
MCQEIYSRKSPQKRKAPKKVSPAPTFRQLAQRFIEVQQLRDKVRAAESERGKLQTVMRN